MNKEEFLEGWSHFCKCINFGVSPLDADAIVWMNNFENSVNAMSQGKKEWEKY